MFSLGFRMFSGAAGVYKLVFLITHCPYLWGCWGDSSTAGVLAREYDETAVTYRDLHGRWKELALVYKANACAAILPGEKFLWEALSRRLLEWASADHFRTQFRLCEFSKIGNIVCHNQSVGANQQSTSSLLLKTWRPRLSKRKVMLWMSTKQFSSPNSFPRQSRLCTDKLPGRTF